MKKKGYTLKEGTFGWVAKVLRERNLNQPQRLEQPRHTQRALKLNPSQTLILFETMEITRLIAR